MTMAARASMNVPTNSKKALIMIKTAILLFETLKINAAMDSGTLSIAMILPNNVAMAINMMIAAEEAAACAK